MLKFIRKLVEVKNKQGAAPLKKSVQVDLSVIFLKATCQMYKYMHMYMMYMDVYTYGKMCLCLLTHELNVIDSLESGH